VFHHLSTLLGCPLITADGKRRAIRNFLFDDRSWQVRYLVVDAGKWFTPRLVVVPTSAVNLPDWTGKIIRTHLTAQEISACPHAETVRPVSSQQKLAWNRHFGWRDKDPNWSGPSTIDFPRREFNVSDHCGDPHLRRTRDLISYQVWTEDGYLGLLQGFLLGDGSWHIGYFLARTGDWIYGEKVLSSSSVVGISWGQGRVLVESQSDTIRQEAS
jgi:hypothetical protein